MTKRNELLLAASALAIGTLLAAGAANAADLTMPMAAPAPMAAPSWTGFYAGLGIYGTLGQNSIDFVKDTSPGTVEGTDSLSPTAFGGTIDGGWDWQHGGMVFGVAGNFDFALSHSTLAYLKDPDGMTTMYENLGNSWGLGLRAGFLATPQTLFYGAAGYAGAQLHYDDIDLAQTRPQPGGTATLAGYYVGVGAETLLKGGWSLKTEYRYSSYSGAFNTADFGGPGTNLEGGGDHYASYYGLNTNSVRLTFDKRF